jgi:hypothetical protein
LSTIVRITSKPFDNQRLITKFKEMDFHGPSTIVNGCNNPYIGAMSRYLVAGTNIVLDIVAKIEPPIVSTHQFE